jgi:hypothetical protein
MADLLPDPLTIDVSSYVSPASFALEALALGASQANLTPET